MRLRFALIVLLAFPAICLAQEIKPGATITPKGNLPLRSAPPGGLIGLKGDEIGTATPSVQFKVLETKDISTVAGGQKWIKVQQMNNTANVGWIFTGPSEKPDSNITMLSR